jgi:hypothetical protein
MLLGPKVDPSYELPDGSKFRHVDELRELLSKNEMPLAMNLARQLTI